MSGVRLSPGSPGVERVSRAPGSPRSHARRRLFGGPGDEQSVTREAERYCRELEAEQRARWNYDFANEQPLPGALIWEEAGPETPEFYRRPSHPNRGRPIKRILPPAEPPPPSVQSPHRTEEAAETSEERSSPAPEQTPKKSRPST